MDFLITSSDMIIYFEDSVEDCRKIDSEMMHSFISELLRASRKGNHLVIISRHVCDWALADLPLSGIEHGQLKRLKEKYTQSAGVLKYAGAILRVRVDCGEGVEIHGCEYCINVGSFLNGGYCNSASFVVENTESDGKFFKFIFDSLKKNFKIKDFSFNLINGGGGTTHVQFESEIKKNNIVVCVCDQDSLFPNKIENDSLKKAIRIGKSESYIGNVFPLCCREVENIIPLFIVKDMYAEIDKRKLSIVQSLIDNQGSTESGDCMWLYYDVKEGMSGTKILEKSSNLRENINWIKNKYNVSEEDIKNINFTGFGSRVIEVFLRSNERWSEFYSFIHTAYWKKHFYDFFENLYWFFVCEKRVSV